jgi:phosphoribosylformylglycinamidine cyclo-ligase
MSADEKKPGGGRKKKTTAGGDKKKAASKAKTASPAPKRTSTYKDAGVDIEAGAEVVKRIRNLAKTTFSSRVITDIGGFSALFSLDVANYSNPVLVSSTDGVGSKLKLAFQSGIHDTIGIDLVAMVVNDILAQGARPLFFLDYLAMSRVDPDVAEQIMKGVTAGCKESNCALIGGETAELPDFYAENEYDLAGFIVGVVERDRIIDGSEIAVGDRIVGFASSGLHSNGYTLARRLLLEDMGLGLDDALFGNRTVVEELLTPTRIYVSVAHVLIRDFKVLGIAHITGGGLIENVPRILPQGCQAVIDKNAWPRPEIFGYIQQNGQVAETEMFRTFNMGLGLVMIVPHQVSEDIMDLLRGMNEPAWLIGEIRERKGDEPALVLE